MEEREKEEGVKEYPEDCLSRRVLGLKLI